MICFSNKNVACECGFHTEKKCSRNIIYQDKLYRGKINCFDRHDGTILQIGIIYQNTMLDSLLKLTLLYPITES